MEKRGLSTFRMLDELADRLDLPSRAMGHAGLKDTVAVTRQWVSVPPERDLEPTAAQDVAGDGWRVISAARHERGLRVGALRGNRFAIVLRGCDPEQHLDTVREHMERMARRGVVNGFGPQRFGRGGHNLGDGLRLLTRASDRDRRRKPKRLLRLLISAVQSEVFHRVLVRRVDEVERLRDGDLAWLHRNGASFAVADAATEQPRADAFEISPSGPLPGPKVLAPDGEVGQWEADALASVGLTMDHFAVLPHKLAPGDRRPLRVPLADWSVAAAPAA